MKRLLFSIFLISMMTLLHAAEERVIRIKSEVRVSGRFVLLEDLVTSTDLLNKEERKYIILDSPERGNKKFTIRSIAIKMQDHESLLNLSLIAPRNIKVFRIADKNFIENVKTSLLEQLQKKDPWKDQKNRYRIYP